MPEAVLKTYFEKGENFGCRTLVGFKGAGFVALEPMFPAITINSSLVKITMNLSMVRS